MFSRTFTPYFHVVFTLPHALNALAQGNPRVIYTLLFRAAAETLLAFVRDPRHLGGTIGITAILHTWSQTLTEHLHVHCLVTGGALSRDQTRWIHGRAAFLFPVKALSIVFRAKYLKGLHRAFQACELTFAAGTTPLADTARFAALLAQLRATPLGRLCEAALWRPRSRPHVPRALHAPQRDLERPLDQSRRRRRPVSVEGLRRSRPHEDHGARRRRVPAALPAPRAPAGLRADPPLRPARQRAAARGDPPRATPARRAHTCGPRGCRGPGRSRSHPLCPLSPRPVAGRGDPPPDRTRARAGHARHALTAP